MAHVPSGGVPKPGEDIPQEDRANSAELIRSSAEFARSPCAASYPGLESAPEGT